MAAGDLLLVSQNSSVSRRGFFKSTDGGDTWGSLISAPSEVVSLQGGAIDARNGDLWAASTNPDGIYKSTDGGATWGSKIAPPAADNTLTPPRVAQTNVTGIAIDPRNGDIWICGSSPDGIYKSTDGGATWGNLIAGPSGQTNIRSIEIDSRNGDIWITGNNPGRRYKSTDGGASWATGIAAPSGQNNFQGFSINPTNGDFWACGTNPNRLEKSTNSGSTWTTVAGPANVGSMAEIHSELNTSPQVAIQTAAQQINGGTAIQLAATASDPDGTIATIAWTADGGAFSDASILNPIWTAPAAMGGFRVYLLRLTVTDDDGAASTALLSMTVNPAPNAAPVVNIATPAQTVDAGAELQLAATATDDGSIASLVWSASDGEFSDAAILNPIWTAPEPAIETSYALRLTATDDGGATSFVEVVVTVRAAATPPPEPPIVPQPSDDGGPDMYSDVRLLFEVFDDTQNLVLHDRIWTGDGNLQFDGQTWVGVGPIVAITDAKEEIGAPSSRLEMSIAATDAAVRASATRDPGPRQCTLRWIYSADNGQSWTAVPRRFRGRLSSPRLDEATYTITLELDNGDRETSAPLVWSDEDYRERSTADVTYGGGRYLAELEAGLTVRWPA